MRARVQWLVAASVVLVTGSLGLSEVEVPDRSGFTPLLADLKSPGPALRAQAAEALGEIKDDRSVEALIAALKDSDWPVREAAARSLGKRGDRRAVEPLIAVLKEDISWSVKQAAAESLGRIRDRRAVEPLVEAMKAADWLLRLAAIKALGEIGDVKAVEPIATILKSREDYFHPAAVEALGKIQDPRSLDALITALKSPDPAVRLTAARALGEMGEPIAVEPLLGALKDQSREIRGAAACALGYIKAKRAVTPLIAACRDADAGVRKAVVVALGQIKEPLAVEPLLAMLGDKDRYVRLVAAQALGKIGDAKAVKPLIAVASDDERPIGDAAVVALAVIDQGSPLEPFREVLKEHGDYLRACSHATWVLGKRRDAGGVDSLLIAATRSGRFWFWGTRVSAAEALAQIKSVRALERLIGDLKQADPATRQYAAVALGVIKDGRAVEPLVAALKDRAAEVRWAAALALGQFDDQRIVPALIAALDDRNANVRAEAARALGRLKDDPPRRIEALIAALKDNDERVRKAVAEALAAIADPRAVEPLLAVVDDREWVVRDAAARALKAMTGRDPLRQLQPSSKSYRQVSRGPLSQVQIDEARRAGVPPVVEVQLGKGVAMNMVFIPPGKFAMGDGAVIPNPPHKVTLTRGFYMAVFPATVGQFRRFAADTGYRTTAERDVMYQGAVTARARGPKNGLDRWPRAYWRSPGLAAARETSSSGFEQDHSHPVVCVSWHDASAFCRWLSRKTGRTFRLPTEAQWEYACRAGRSNAQSRYPWGAGWPPPARAGNLCDEQYKSAFPGHKWAWYVQGYRDGHAFTSPVGAYPANPWGLCDMAGNVQQWCSDWYRITACTEDTRDPEGPATGIFRTVRGSSWFNADGAKLRSAWRGGGWPWDRWATQGFRVVLTAP